MSLKEGHRERTIDDNYSSSAKFLFVLIFEFTIEKIEEKNTSINKGYGRCLYLKPKMSRFTAAGRQHILICFFCGVL